MAQIKRLLASACRRKEIFFQTDLHLKLLIFVKFGLRSKYP